MIAVRPLILAIALAAPALGWAQDIPDAGIAAEMRQDWAEATSIYRDALEQRPGDAVLWQRLAQVQAAAGDTAGAADAFGRAAALRPQDADAQARHSSALAVAGHPAEALAAIDRALKLAPGDAAYLRSHAVLATWNGQHRQALDSYLRVLESEPHDPANLLAVARAAKAAGDRRVAARNYREYLNLLPQDREVMLEYMTYAAESGDIAALNELDGLFRERFGASKDYQVRLADLYAMASDSASAMVALEKAAEASGGDHALYFRIAEMRAAQDNADGAAAAIEHAVNLSPANVQYLEARANYASWRGDYQTALASYDRILAIEPDSESAWLGKARVSYWQGALRQSDLAYGEYTSRQPNVAVVWLEHARVLSELGDFSTAVGLVEGYVERFGDNPESRQEMARIYAWAGFRHRALSLNTPLLEATPEDYGLNYTQVVALRQGQIPGQTRPSLQRVQRIEPESKATEDIVRSTRVVLASKVIGWFDFFEDSDDIRTLNYGVDGRWVRNDQLTLLAGVGERRVRAPIAGPFAPDSGGNNVHDRRLTVGARYAIDDDYAVTARVGVSDLDTQDSKAIYALELDALASDTFSFLVGLERDRVTASPRSLDRDIARTGAYTRVRIRPDLRNTIDIGGAFNDQSDDNEGVHINGAWRRAMIRTPDLQLDAGLSGEWLHFERDNDNGYYSPDNYRRIGALVGAYIPFGDDAGLSVQLGLGIQRDENFDQWERASDIGVEYTRGIFKDWQVKFRVGYLERVQNTGAFEGASFGVEIERRF